MSLIKLQSLTLSNFKGIESLSVDFGSHTVISGRNGTGKTSIFDAFTWLLFGKDHDGNSKFDLKPLDANGDEIKRKDVQVKASIDVDGHTVLLERTYKEKWKKTRGAVEPTLAGHTEEFRMNEQPLTASAWKKAIDELCPESIFRSITAPGHFAEQKWEEQRKLLFSIVDLSPEDVREELNTIAPANDAEQVFEAFKDENLDAARSSILAKKKALKAPIDSIPTRIDELKRSIPEIDKDEKEVRAMLDRNESEQGKLLRGLGSSPESEERRRLSAKLETLLAQIRAQVAAEYNQTATERAAAVGKLNAEFSKIEPIAKLVAEIEAQIESSSKERERLIEEWRSIKAETFNATAEDFRCPCCDRPFEPHQIETKRVELLEKFNIDKAKRLEENQKRGKDLKGRREDLERRLEESRKAKERMIEINAELLSLRTKERTDTPLEDTIAKAVDGNAEISELRLLIEALPDTEQPEDNESVNRRLEELRSEQKELLESLSVFERVEKTNQRIKELRSELSDLSQQYAEIERKEDMLTQYMRAYATAAERKINEKFRIVKFRLFDYLIDGTPKETCKATVNGVAYNSTLNSAARINAGLDIIRTLCEHYKVQAPVFVDNAESVNNLLRIPSQTVEMRVTTEDLTVTIQDDNTKQ